MKKCIIILVAILLTSCGDRQSRNTTTNKDEPKKNVVVPAFNADSAYQFVKVQTDFGPRVPETEAHCQCAEWLTAKLSGFADTVIVQDFRTRIFNGKSMDGQNIVASFNPNAKKRIVLCSHWDSRPFADHDADEANWNTPIDGANDGASGVGVLLECARLFKSQPLNGKLGVDIILFDLEDYGPRQDEAEKYYADGENPWALGSQYWAKQPHIYGYKAYYGPRQDEAEKYYVDGENPWALGSQYWAKQPHIYGYKAYYGILLDMVGGSNPNFPKEYYSQGFAAWLSNKVWSKAYSLGYSHCFSNELGDPISDDHIPMNQAGLPTIDIIDLQPHSSNGSFPEMWHTLDDNISNIDKETLGMVGNVVVNMVYNE